MNDPFEIDEGSAAPDMRLDSGPVAGDRPAPDYLANLNPEQRAAVETLDGPLLVLAGAGTGKTRVLTTRLAHLLQSKSGAPEYLHPQQILAVTFTNRAAREMQERVASALGRPVEGWWLGTFHSLAARLLRRHAELIGLKPNFTILDSDDQVRLLKQILDAEQIDAKKWPAKQLMGIIQRWKDRGQTPDRVTETSEFANGRCKELYRIYQDRLAVLNAADFGDLLLHCLTLFQQNPEILRQYQNSFRYILVDEYQDTNVAQYLWLRALAMAHHNICCVGDDDQAIYSWRGAEVGNILRFDQDFPGAKVVRLEQNYRSTPHILAAASTLITHNEGRLGKELWTELDHGDKVQVKGVWDGEAEARLVGEDVEALQREGIGASRMAVLVRAGFQTREFEERLITLGIPYRVIGGPRFYERQEIRDALAYIRMVAQPDDSLAFERIVNVPKRGIGKATLQMLHQYSRDRSVSLPIAVRELLGTEDLKPKMRQTLGGLLDDFDRWRAMLAEKSHVDVLQIVLDESGYTEMWQQAREPDAPGRLENLKELVSAIGEFENLTVFLEHVSLVMENDQSDEREKITLMTLHAAKGLEFDYVFLPGWEEGVFPHQRAMDESGIKGLEEERRLAYVGITRARKRATVAYAANRRIYNQWQSALPSRFIDELPEDHIERTSDTGLSGGRGAVSPGAWGADDWMKMPSWSESGTASASQASERRFASTGWQGRMRSKIIDVPSDGEKSYNISSSGSAKYKVGDAVKHRKFGPGTVRAVEGNKLEIDFRDAGLKKVVDSFILPG
ncbi:ATP-dependent helicase [Thalassospira sp.]|uniref:ATP-dependent helicase n=1 Tax=Thalassospira sp. TaxID=1912094 RepID=UPI00273732F1|nr:UvrD-helicase domain-containing protein [Thalassospira sp.]MDP2698607.1 UvrD-helicase domain-containing protein [Thalassospira sp.]